MTCESKTCEWKTCEPKTCERKTCELPTCGLKIGRDANSATKAKPREAFLVIVDLIIVALMIVAERRCPLFGNALKGGGP